MKWITSGLADRPEVGQITQDQRVCRYLSDRRADNFRIARNSGPVPSLIAYTSLVQSHAAPTKRETRVVRNYETAQDRHSFGRVHALTGSLVCSGLAQTNSQRSRQAEPTEVKGFSDSDKTALSRQVSSAVSRGDAPGVVALIVGREGVLFEGAAGKLDVARDIPMPV